MTWHKVSIRSQREAITKLFKFQVLQNKVLKIAQAGKAREPIRNQDVTNIQSLKMNPQIAQTRSMKGSSLESLCFQNKFKARKIAQNVFQKRFQRQRHRLLRNILHKCMQTKRIKIKRLQVCTLYQREKRRPSILITETLILKNL